MYQVTRLLIVIKHVRMQLLRLSLQGMAWSFFKLVVTLKNTVASVFGDTISFDGMSCPTDKCPISAMPSKDGTQ